MSTEIKWYLDSGATEHLINSSVQLKNVKRLSEPIKINVAKSGTFLYANCVGEIEVTSCVNGKKISILITDVLSVPNLSYNLLSVRKLESKGLRVIFENGKGIIQKDDMTLAVAQRSESNMYTLNFTCKEPHCHVTSPVETIELWHERLAHLSYDNIRKLQMQVDGMNFKAGKSEHDFCHTCIEGKQTSQPHNSRRGRATRPLELIHSDLIGPVSPVSYDNKRYVLTFIDDFTHFTCVYFLETKSEVTKYFKIFEAMSTAHFNLKISRFRCDNGREYISNELKAFCEDLGIQF